MPEFDVAETSARRTSRIVKTAVSPRPIAWISSQSGDGVDNLAPFSSYNYLGSSPPVVFFNASRRANGRLKDTAVNALETGEFAVNVVTAGTLEPMDDSSEGIPPGQSEFELTGLERAPCRTITPPRVADAAVTMECTLYDSLEIYDRMVILGDVTYIHVAEELLTDGKIDARNLDTVGRLGGPFYTVSDPLTYERKH